MNSRTVKIILLAAGAIALALPSYSQGPTPVGKLSVWGGKVPKSIEIFYDQVLDRLGGAGANADKIPQALAKDWQTRPNPLNSVEGDGPGAEGVKAILGAWSSMIVDSRIERQHTLVNGDMVTVLSRFSGTINPNLPADMTELPMFPGIPAEKIKGRSFVTMAMDTHVLGKDGLIHRTWHMEDWASAQAQLLGRVPSVDLGFGPGYLNFK